MPLDFDGVHLQQGTFVAVEVFFDQIKIKHSIFVS